MSQGQNGSFKHVQANQFNQFMQEKMSGQVGVVSGLKRITDSNLMPPPDQQATRSDQFLKQEEPSSQELIEMAANQCLKESGGE